MEILTIFLLLTIFVNFVLLTKGVIKTEVGMWLTALIAVILSGPVDGLSALENGFSEFAKIAILFTAIATPAHMLQRSDILEILGMRIGEFIGYFRRKYNFDYVLMAVGVSLLMTYILAGLFHNTTSILVSAAIITIICKSYKIPGIPVLSAALIASNLGGFSTRWGDTPNIIEAFTWNLNHFDFFMEIMPVNLGLILILILITTFLVKKQMNGIRIDKSELVYSMVKFRTRRRNTKIDMRLFLVAIFSIVFAIVGPLFFPEYEIVIAAFAIIICVIGDYASSRKHTIFALGGETYATLVAIFVLSQVMAYSHIGIGEWLKEILFSNSAPVWLIAVASYFGTLLTEAASWANAASPIVNAVDISHRAAWALGGGICAGSSSLVTAASAGVILMHETEDNEKNSRITFGSYIKFGLPFSLFMLLYYVVILNLLF